MNDLPKSNTQDQEKTNISSPKNKRPKKKMCILTKILIGSVLAMILFFLLAILIANTFKLHDTMNMIAIPLIIFAMITFPLLAIVSMLRISLNSNLLKGRVICTLLLVILCFLIYNAAYYSVPRARNRPFRCGVNLKGLGTALTVYANDNNGYLPSQDWCDRLIEEVDVSPKSFFCVRADSENGESDYCLNKYAAGKKLSELPDNMVLLFEAVINPAKKEKRQPIKNRETFSDLEVMQHFFTGEEKVYLNQWNQIGGPELLDASRHHEGCYILFANGKSEFVKLEKMSELRWNIIGDVSFDMSLLKTEEPSIISQKTVLLTILGGLCVVVTLYILVKFKTIRYSPFVLGIAILSTGTGMFFGNMSEEAYLSVGTTGHDAGGIFGLMVGICFAVLLANTPDRIKSLKTFKGFSASVGMITGIICSTLVHLALIIVNEETNFAGILIGIPYGIFAGAVLGFIGGWIVKKFYSPKPPVSVEVESD